MSATPTPRTDAAEVYAHTRGEHELVVDSSVARQLETELTEAKRYIQATEYWQLDPQDCKERTAFFRHLNHNGESPSYLRANLERLADAMEAIGSESPDVNLHRVHASIIRRALSGETKGGA